MVSGGSLAIGAWCGPIHANPWAVLVSNDAQKESIQPTSARSLGGLCVVAAGRGRLVGETGDIYEVVDCVPLPACSLAQSKRQGSGHWLWWGTKGYGGTRNNWYWGDQVLMSVSPQEAVTGWIVASAHTDDRWLLQMLISQRQERGQLVGPPPKQPSRTSSPPTHIGPLIACGNIVSTRVYVGDKGFGGHRWRDHWTQHYHVQVISAP